MLNQRAAIALRGLLLPVVLLLALPVWSCPVATSEGSIEISKLTIDNFSPVGSVKALDVPQRADADRAMAATECVGGFAGPYPCRNIDLQSFLPLSQIGGGGGNDIWGWTDDLSGREYAIMGRTNGTSFVDITDPENPVYLGNLPTHTGNSTWRDIKVNKNHAYIVSEASGHGMQVFDLRQLRDVTNPPQTFSNTTHYAEFGNAHNIVMNEDTGFAYAVGTSTCSGGLHMIDVSSPTSPTFSGCYATDGYTHDAQCVTWNGNSHRYHHGSEVCFNSNEDTLTIVDVTNKANPVQLARLGYSDSEYTHQGWLSEDHNYFLLDDELDEARQGHNTRTRIFDVSDPSAPVLTGFYDSTSPAIDHNMYIKGDFAYQANYRAGLRIIELKNPSNGILVEEAYFDIFPSNDNPNFNGAWSVYPYFESGNVVISGIESGLFVVKPTSLTPTFNIEVTPERLEVCDAGNVVADVSLTSSETFIESVELTVSGAPAGATASFAETSLVPPATVPLVVNVKSAVDGQYMLTVDGEAGDQRVAANAMLEVSSMMPVASAAVLPANGDTNVSANQTIQWQMVDGAFRYDLEVATDANFTDVVVNAPDLTVNSYAGGSLPSGTTLYWRVTSHNACGSAVSTVSSFSTAAPVCELYESKNVPVNISATDVVSVSSVLQTTSPGQVIDVNVIGLNGTHSYVGDLTFKLQGPQIASHERNSRHAERALVRLISESCGAADDFSVSLDDDAPGDLPCPYNDGGTYKPEDSMSPFAGNPATGEWTLIIEDSYPADGGVLQGWALEICTTPEPLALDSDGDGVIDPLDNCTLVANPDQRDTHGDGFGNICDPDINNDGTVNFLDVAQFSDAFLQSGKGLDADFNGDLAVNFLDLMILQEYAFGPPGPSGSAIQ